MDDTTLTYAELDALSSRYANGLIALGVRRGERVAVHLHNSIDYVALYLAITSIGAVIVRVNFRLHADEVAFVLEDSEAVLWITDAEKRDVDVVRERVPECRVSAALADLASENAEPPDLPLPRSQDPAMLMYTSGTTGAFKGVEWSHDATMWHAALQALHHHFDEQTVAMTTGPLYHIGALENWLSACLFVHGHGVISPSRDFRVVATLEQASRHSVTDAFMFSFMFDEMMRRLEANELSLGSLRTLFIGGAGLPATAAALVEQHLPDARLMVGYGMTETGTTTAGVLTDQMTADFVGSVMPGYEIAVFDGDGVEALPGVEGQILARGPSVASGYWNRPAESAEVFHADWCESGDIGVVDGLGNLHLRGRTKDLVRTGGENVHPGEVESVLMSHPDVVDAAVIGVPDPQLTECICALVVRRDGSTISSAELTDFVKGRIASYKKPRIIEFVVDLPRNASGKLLKPALREKYSHLGAVTRSDGPTSDT